MSLIQVNHLTFGYDGSYDNIFEDVSFQLDTNWKLGFTGRNGRGKTTFMQLLMGKHDYNGSITSSVEFQYFPFEINNAQEQTIDIIAELLHDTQLWELQRELSLLQLEDDVLYRPFNTLSSGEQCKVMLAALFLKENQFLLIDEPTNHLDTEGREIVGQYLRRKHGFILVSHDRAFLDHCVDHILSMNKSSIEIQQGSFSSWWDNKERQDQYERAENDRLKRDIDRLNQAARQAGQWSHEVEKSKNGTLNSGSKIDKGYVGHKAAKMMKRAKNIEQRQRAAIEDKSKLLHNIENQLPIKMTPLIHHKSQLVILQNAAVQYNNKEVCNGINLTIEQGDRIAIIGKNGSGKSSLLKLICGEELSYSGSITRASQLRISYVSQDTSHLRGKLKDYAQAEGIDEALFKSLLRKLDFSRDQFEKELSTFSGGQKKKVLIAKSICEPAHLYVWDEPLNFIDVISRMQIEELLLQYKPTLVFVEHDRRFTENIATQQYELIKS